MSAKFRLIPVAALALFACTKTPAYLYGRDLTGLQLGTLTTNEGIYPDTTILDDANNPFAEYPPSDQGKWIIQSGAGPVAAYYSWATLNALTPNGEAQFYTGKNLELIYTMLPMSTPQAQKDSLKDQAVRTYQAVLDNFPTSVTYPDASGKNPLSLATLALQGIVENLKGKAMNNWVLVVGKDGTEEAVHQ